MAHQNTESACPADEVLSLFRGKWKSRIVWQPKQGPIRFGELRRRVVGVSQKVLTGELKELVAAGAVKRTLRAEAPVLNVEYELTSLGHQVSELVGELGDWGAEHLHGRAHPE